MINLNQATAPFRIETRLITRRKEESGEGTALAVIFVRHPPIGPSITSQVAEWRHCSDGNVFCKMLGSG